MIDDDDIEMMLPQGILEAASQVLRTAGSIIQANTICITSNDRIHSTVIRSVNRKQVIVTEGLRLPYEESYCHLVVGNDQEPLIIDDNTNHPLTSSMKATGLIGSCSFLGVPIITRSGEIFGTLCAFDPEHFSFQPEHAQMMSSLAAFFAYGLEVDRTMSLLNQALEEKSGLMAIMSHEIRTSLNGMMSMTDLLRDTELHEEQLRYVAIIQSSGHSLLGILGKVLDYSRLQSGKMDVEQMPFNVHACVEQAVALFTVDAQNKGIALSCRLDEGVPELLAGDELKLRQVLLNLISNAVKFTCAGSIAVEAGLCAADIPDERGARWMQLWFKVSDTGMGISEEMLGRLFEPYARLHSASSLHPGGGTGLGLSICKQLVGLMGGAIQLKETSPQGTVFQFTIGVQRLELHDE